MGKKNKKKQAAPIQKPETVQVQKPDANEKNIFDEDFKKGANSDSDDLAELNDFSKNGQKAPKDSDFKLDFGGNEEAKVARATTKATDNGRKYAPEKYKYSFMTDDDRNKSNTFRQNLDPTIIQPKKIEDQAELQKVKTQTEKEMNLTGSAWNKSGTTWVDKNLKLKEVEKYLISQKIIIGEGGKEAQQLQLTGLEDTDGFCNLAMIRGDPRMGFELSFKATLTGVENTYLQGMTCTLEIKELCDDGGEPESCDISMTEMLDTQQGSVAKDVVGYSDDCMIFCKEVVKVLREYPKRASKV